MMMSLSGYGRDDDNVDSSQIETPSPEIIEAVHIDIHGAPGRTGEFESLARDLIYLKEGQVVSDRSIIRALEELRASGRFEEIDVQSSQDDAKVILTFSLKPFALIKDIRITGSAPLFEKDVLDAMTMYTGGTFSMASLPDQERLIAELFVHEGFFEPMISVAAHEDDYDGTIILNVTVEKGPYYKLKELIFTGNRAFTDSRLRSKMSIWRSSFLPGSAGRFVEEDLKKDLKNLVSYYREKGFFDCRVDFALDKDLVAKTVSMKAEIHEGPEYEASISGNHEFFDYTIRKELVFLKEGNQGERGLRKSIKNIQQLYLKAGYTQADIEVRKETVQVHGLTVHKMDFIVDEGPRTLIENISFEGNQAFDAEKLQKQINLRSRRFFSKGVYARKTLEEDFMALKTFYLRNGFLDASIESKEIFSQDKTSVRLVFSIHEGGRTTISSIRITGLRGVSQEDAYRVISLKTGEPLRRYMIQSDENALSSLIAEHGYPYVKVEARTIFRDDRLRADIVYEVDEGTQVAMGQVYFEGNFKTKERVLLQEIDMQPGKPFSLKRMLYAQRNIRDMDIFNSVQFKTLGLNENRDEITLLVNIEERKPYYVQFGAGYESAMGMFGKVRGGDHNLFGLNKDIWAAGEISQIGYRLETGIEEPRIFSSRISAGLGVFSEKREEFNQDFGTRMYGTNLSFSTKISSNMRALVGFRYEYRHAFLKDGVLASALTYDEDELDPRSILVTTPSIIFDTRDSFVKPTSGIFSSFSVDLSKGIRNSYDNFFKYRLDTRYYVSPLSFITMAFLARLGYIDDFGGRSRIPDDQLFYLGGTLDVRGYDENSLRIDVQGDPQGGLFALAGSVEARVDLGRNIELACFYDMGTVRDTYEDMGSNDLRSSLGLGLRYITPIGPLGILYGHKLDRKEGESAGRFHFSVGYTF